MESKLFAKIVLRLLAVYLIARGIIFLPDFYMLQGQPSGVFWTITNPNLWLVIPVLAPTISGIVLWVIAPMIANWMIGVDNTHVQIPSLLQNDLQAIAIVTAGLIIVIIAVPRIADWLIQLFANSYNNGVSRVFDPGVLGFFIASVLLLLFGLLLIFGIRFWVRLLRRIREFGLEPGNSE
ncbi:MAG: hypothetical protein WCC11_08580 [Gammaproteobacteria bacterium]